MQILKMHNLTQNYRINLAARGILQSHGTLRHMTDESNNGIGLPITLQITARVTWSGWPCIARSHTEISLSLSELLHRGTNIASKL